MKHLAKIILAGALISGSAMAQPEMGGELGSSRTWPGFDIYPVQKTADPYGTDDLGKAMRICTAHEDHHGIITMGGIPQPTIFLPAWTDCYAVRQKWNASEGAKYMREHEEQEKADLDFVRRMAGDKK